LKYSKRNQKEQTQLDVDTQVSLQRGQMGVNFDQIIVVEGIFKPSLIQ
jgi:hypothetical protein